MARSIRSILTALLFIILILPFAQAQTSVAEIAITHIEANALNTGEVQVAAVVSVLDQFKSPVLDLQPADFTLQEDSTTLEPQTLSIAPATAPISLTLLIDTSRNMAGAGPYNEPVIESVRKFATAFAESLDPDDQIAVYSYSDQLHSHQDFTDDHNLAINQGIGPLIAGDVETACLYDALSNLVQNLTGQRQGRQLILVLTASPDSAAACQGATVDDVIDAAVRASRVVPIYTVGFGEAIDRDELLRLSERTGGQRLIAGRSTLPPDLAAIVSAQIQGQYEVSYVTQRESGLATIRITATGAQNSASREVVIPTAVPPTPTPVPQFAIGLDAEPANNGRLLITLTIPDHVTLEKTELFVDNSLVQKAISEPFDQFRIEMQELSSGKHKIRAEATDINNVLAMAEVEVIVPTPVPPPASPTPVLSPTPAPEPDPISSLAELPFLLIAIGLIILLALLALIGYLIFFYTRRPSPRRIDPPPALPPVDPLITVDDEQPLPVGSPDVRARLVVVTGREALAQSSFDLPKTEVKIGRNTAKDSSNAIPIQDKEVSRSHAKISYRDQNYFIQDLNSSGGTLVNLIKIRPPQEMMLQNGAEIMIGPNVKLRFELITPQPIDQTLDDFLSLDELRTQDDAEDPDQTYYSRTKK